MSEQRQSSRFSRQFLVTDYQDEHFELAFEGWDVNLTGLSFWVNDPDLFMPGQMLALRVKAEDTAEMYALDSVEVVHLQERDGLVLCGCHIAQVTSDQLLAHHRLVMLNEAAASQSMSDSELREFDFNQTGSSMSFQPADYQQASFALNLAVEELTGGVQSDEASWEALNHGLEDLLSEVDQDQQQSVLSLIAGFKRFHQSQESRNEQVLALSLLAKMLVHTPETEADRLSWQTLLRDFETRFLDERLLLAYDLMHQGLEAGEALQRANDQLALEKDSI